MVFSTLGRKKWMAFHRHVFQASSFSIFSISLFGGCVNWKTHIAFFGFSRTWNLPAPCPKIKPLNYLTKVCKQPEVFQHVQASFFHNSRINRPFFNHRQRTIPKRWASAGYFPHPPPGLSASCDIPGNGTHWTCDLRWDHGWSWYQSGEGETFGEEPIAHLVSSWYRIAQLGDSCCEKQWLQEFAGTAKLGWEKRWSDWCFC